MASESVPVIAIDGPSASGKGTVAQKVAAALGFHYLDSGALYRLVTLAALKKGVSLDDEARLAETTRDMRADFRAVATRAERRYKQLMEKGMYAKIEEVVEELRRRDARDTSRAVAPLKHYPDAFFLDTTGLSVDAAVHKILEWWRERPLR